MFTASSGNSAGRKRSSRLQRLQLMLTTTVADCETPVAVEVNVTVWDPDGTLFELLITPPPQPASPQAMVKLPASSNSTNPARCSQPFRLRDASAKPSRPKGASTASVMLLRDCSRDAVVAETEIVPVAVIVAVPLNVTDEGVTLHFT